MALRGWLVLASVVIMVGSCATQPLPTADSPPGFLSGFFHGFTLWFSLIGSTFIEMRVYAFPNSGGWYDFGFVLGATTALGSAARATD
jgi:hypothetical protein